MARHVTPEKLGELLASESISREEVVELLKTLLQRCPDCVRALEQVLAEFRAGAPEPRQIARAFAPALARIDSKLDALSRAKSLAEREFRSLVKLPAAERRLRISRSHRRFRNPVLVDLLVEESRRRVTEQPFVAHELAECAVDVAMRLPVAEVGQAWAMTLIAQAQGQRGNALRATGDFRGAEGILAFAHQLFEQEGNGDPLVEAELLQLTATLRREQRRFEEAEQALDTATELYRSCGDASQAARILVKRGFVYYEAGQPERAVEVTRQALPSIDGARDPRLLLCAQHNLVWFLEQAGRLEEARQLLDQVQSLYDQFGDPGTQLRRQWVVGRIARGLGERERAEQALTATRLGFLSQGLGFDSALVGLDLALLYIELGRPNEVKRLAEEMVPIFLMQDIHREATAALLLFQEAARQEAATVPMVAQLIAYLERVRKGSKDLVS